MRVIYSDEVKKLRKKVEPYIERIGMVSRIKATAPQEIKEDYEKWKELVKKENEEAMM